METTRQNKISRLLQKELSEIFLLQTKAMPGNNGNRRETFLIMFIF